MRQWRQNTLQGFYPPLLRCHPDNHMILTHSYTLSSQPYGHKIARQFLHYDRYRVARGLERPLPSICMYMHVLQVRQHDMYTSNTQQASYPFWRGPCDACAADHVINSSRPSASVFPPPHLIITRNAHGAEEGEGLGTRLELDAPSALRAAHKLLIIGRAEASPPSLTTGAPPSIYIFIYLFIYIVRPTLLAPGWPRATRKRSRPDRGGVRLQLLLCYIYTCTCSTDMPDVQSSYESRHSYEFRRNESSKGTLEGASPS